MGTTLRNAAWSTSGLIESISRNTLLPLNQETFERADLMAMMNEATSNTVVPFVLGLDSGYFLKTVLIPIVTSNSTALSVGFSGNSGDNVPYRIPADAVGCKTIDVSVLSNNGVPVNCPLVSPWQVGRPAGVTWGCWIENDTLYLFPANGFNGNSYIQLVYPAAPLALCDDTGTAGADAANAAQVASVDTTAGTISMTPLLPASFVVGADINIVRGTPPFATSSTATILEVAGLQITVDPTLLVNSYQQPLVQAGDWVANAGYSPFLQLPAEGRNLVTQATIVKVLQALKDDGWKDAEATYEKLELAAHKLFSPRINDSPKVISSYGAGIGQWRRYGPWVSR